MPAGSPSPDRTGPPNRPRLRPDGDAVRTPVGATGATPTLRVFVTQSRITVERNRRDFVFADPGAWVTPVGDDFELCASRPECDTPITIKQVDPDTKAVLRTFPAPTKDAWAGLKDFARYRSRPTTSRTA
jgi:hypothetical protein